MSPYGEPSARRIADGEHCGHLIHRRQRLTSGAAHLQPIAHHEQEIAVGEVNRIEPARGDKRADIQLKLPIVRLQRSGPRQRFGITRPMIARLFGDPQKAELYAYRVKFPNGFLNKPHFHPDVRLVTVISGTLYFAYGNTVTAADFRPYPAGSFLTEEPGRPHYAWAKDGEVILQVGGYGPTSTSAVAPNTHR